MWSNKNVWTKKMCTWSNKNVSTQECTSIHIVSCCYGSNTIQKGYKFIFHHFISFAQNKINNTAILRRNCFYSRYIIISLLFSRPFHCSFCTIPCGPICLLLMGKPDAGDAARALRIFCCKEKTTKTAAAISIIITRDHDVNSAILRVLLNTVIRNVMLSSWRL